MLHTDLKFVNLLSCHFEKFVRKGDYLFNVRCPLCGDSQVKKTKMRGYIYRDKQRLAFKCHNCNVNAWLGTIIKQLAPQLYKEYIFETFQDKNDRCVKKETPATPPETMPFREANRTTFAHAEPLDKLPPEHPCRLYVESRLIPPQYYSRLYYTCGYSDFLDEVMPDHGKKNLRNDPRLVIPFYDAFGILKAVTGRDLGSGPNALRYITIRCDNDRSQLLYGIDRVNQNKPVYVVEGPIDSLFIENAVAAGNAGLIQAARSLSAVSVTLVFDNEPRSVEIAKQMDKAVHAGFPIVIWPEHIKEKDINAMVLAGYDVQELIYSNIHRGLTALTHLAFWKKIRNPKGVLV